MRARPVPFCFQSFLPEPETSQRAFVLCVPARSEARKCFTASQSRSSLTAPKISSARSKVPTFSPLRLCISIVAISFSVFTCVERALLPASLYYLKSSGQECPLHTNLCLLRRSFRCLQRIYRRRTRESAALSWRLLRLGDNDVAVLR